MGQSLWRFSVFGAMLGAAGLPLYIHAPKYFVDTYGSSLAALGVVLFALRMLDVIQDPLLGRIVAKYRAHVRRLVFAGAGLMCLGMLGLFVVVAPIAPVLWFAVTLACVFTGFSLLTIVFYAQSADLFDGPSQVRVARWRETGQLLGICIAALAPTVMAVTMDAPFAGFAWLFVVLTVLAVTAMNSVWSVSLAKKQQASLLALVAALKPYLVLGFVNAAPVAITSTLFLFFVQYRLGAEPMAGPLLVVFFLSAAASAPFWTWCAARQSAVSILAFAMMLSLVCFVFAFYLGTGDIGYFAVICVLTGITTGADMTLLPVIFTRFLQARDMAADLSFGLWSFASKMALAFAAILVLPALEFSGFDPEAITEQGLTHLSVAYAIVPSFLKLGALYLLYKIGKSDA